MKELSMIELTVNNHPGVMSHIIGLFSRRGFNVEGIIVAPDRVKSPKGMRSTEGRTGTSTVCLSVRANGRLEQILKQLEKLYDIRTVRHVNLEDGKIRERIKRLSESIW